ncbi:MAG TPA: pilus assembly protein PilM [Burkholderiaceae bacterium]|jgi:MSHA biogenesis protein MshI|nr:pilus assembly protein PilM [Burkholderiaceae bacterium]
MLQTNWLRALPLRVLRHRRRALVQVGVYRTSSGLIAARVQLDPEAGCSVERLESADLKGQRDDEVAAAVGQLVRSGILRNAPVMLVLGAEHYNTYPLPAPSVPADEMREALRWKLREVLPYSPEEAVVDFVRLARAADSNAADNLFAVAALRRSVAQATAPFLAAGVNVQAVDIAEMSLRNLLTELPAMDESRALLGLEESSALLTVVHEGALCFARRIQIPRSLGAGDEDPEHVASRIAAQVQHSLEVVERQSGLPPVRSVWIGPHPYCALIARCTAEHSGLECPQLDLQAELRFAVDAGELPPAQAWGAPIAIGAALRSEAPAPAHRSQPEQSVLHWLSRLKPA